MKLKPNVHPCVPKKPVCYQAAFSFIFRREAHKAVATTPAAHRVGRGEAQHHNRSLNMTSAKIKLEVMLAFSLILQWIT
jgi:hypothetical protein